ncbi:hypothetical protein E5Q_03703 [Mixia osmundae IAM 14324]|uniref:Uncharacterized protein n=1 Tax=Mixia osmundae (strain CBS 9802 / IAM 14324 / JCM 22182 / KY 12970) TaxID=764103 RepID=G7E2G8_MIXOS|nr:hypothetical protein E5Q_03703 [Mixia osmundae IAM 14324]
MTAEVLDYADGVAILLFTFHGIGLFLLLGTSLAILISRSRHQLTATLSLLLCTASLAEVFALLPVLGSTWRYADPTIPLLSANLPVDTPESSICLTSAVGLRVLRLALISLAPALACEMHAATSIRLDSFHLDRREGSRRWKLLAALSLAFLIPVADLIVVILSTVRQPLVHAGPTRCILIEPLDDLIEAILACFSATIAVAVACWSYVRSTRENHSRRFSASSVQTDRPRALQALLLLALALGTAAIVMQGNVLNGVRAAQLAADIWNAVLPVLISIVVALCAIMRARHPNELYLRKSASSDNVASIDGIALRKQDGSSRGDTPLPLFLKADYTASETHVIGDTDFARTELSGQIQPNIALRTLSRRESHRTQLSQDFGYLSNFIEPSIDSAERKLPSDWPRHLTTADASDLFRDPSRRRLAKLSIPEETMRMSSGERQLRFGSPEYFSAETVGESRFASDPFAFDAVINVRQPSQELVQRATPQDPRHLMTPPSHGLYSGTAGDLSVPRASELFPLPTGSGSFTFDGNTSWTQGIYSAYLTSPVEVDEMTFSNDEEAIDESQWYRSRESSRVERERRAIARAALAESKRLKMKANESVLQICSRRGRRDR